MSKNEEWKVGAKRRRGAMTEEHENPIVFFDIAVGEPTSGNVAQKNIIGRIKLQLNAEVTPRTAENFLQLCTGEFKQKGLPVGYKGALFHRIIENYAVFGGDFPHKGAGTGTNSIYGSYFDDENTELKHDGRGTLSMINLRGEHHRNGCQFMIALKALKEFDGVNVVFGRVLPGDAESNQVLDRLESLGSGTGQLGTPCFVAQCGQM